MKRAFFSIILLIAFVLNVYANMDSTKVKIDVVDITHTGLINAIKKNVLSDSICEKHKYTGNIIIARQYGHLYSYAYVGLFAKMNVKKRDINTQNNSVFTIIDNYPFFLNVIDGDPHKYYISKKKNYEITYYSYTDKKLVNNKIWIFLLLSDVEVLLMDTLSLNTEEKQSGQLPGEVVYGDAFDFNDGADGDVEYEYDGNGNMTADLNRGIKEITYDVNNRPVSVTFSTRPAEQRTKYLRDASGRKLRTTYQTSRYASLGPDDLVHVDTLKLGPGIGGIGGIGGLKPLSSPAAGIGGSFFDPGLAKDPGEILDMWQTSYVRDYCGDIIYKDGEIERILTDNGYAVPDSAGGYDYYYYVKDWQGNVRAVIDEANRRMELNNYYPYGMPMSSTASVQPYKYGGKELDRTNGLDMYDFHARHYDPIVPRFTTIDPMAEKYPSISPYAYCAGNPIRYVDPDGRDFGILFEGNTLTIKAAYYTSEKDVEYAKESAKIWNDMSGMFSVDSYTINFDLQVVEVPMNEHTLSNDRAVQGILYQNYDQINNPDAGGYGNGFMMVGESNPRLSGKTIDGKFINIYNNQDKTTGAHEMGHTLGLGHSSVGLMTPSASDLWRTNKIGAKEVETIIRNGMMGEILKEGNSSPGKGILLNKPMNPLEEYKVKRIK